MANKYRVDISEHFMDILCKAERCFKDDCLDIEQRNIIKEFKEFAFLVDKKRIEMDKRKAVKRRLKDKESAVIAARLKKINNGKKGWE